MTTFRSQNNYVRHNKKEDTQLSLNITIKGEEIMKNKYNLKTQQLLTGKNLVS